MHANYLIIGGGVAGVCCAQELARLVPDGASIHLVSACEVLLQTSSVHRSTQFLEELTVFEKTADEFQALLPSVTVTIASVTSLDTVTKTVSLSSGEVISFDLLCIATGVKPKLIASHPLIVGLRDLHSIKVLNDKLRAARRIAIIGNGGIALELVHELSAWDQAWIVRENYVGSAFFDATVSQFIMPVLQERRQQAAAHAHPAHSDPPVGAASAEEPTDSSGGKYGYGVGPEWAVRSGFAKDLPSLQQSTGSVGDLQIFHEQEVVAFSADHGSSWQHTSSSYSALQVEAFIAGVQQIVPSEQAYPLLLLTNQQVIGVDFAISATGVTPDLSFLQDTPIALDADGYITVSNSSAVQSMQTNIPFVFAAGDCCAYTAPEEVPFFAMKLWTQARIMGTLAAQSMLQVQHEYGVSMHFELFAHITRFFGRKVVLLGRYNAQGLGQETEALVRTVIIPEHSAVPVPIQQPSRRQCDLEVLVRITPLVEVVKLVIYKSKLVGALLIGETELEEAMENLILNEIDVHSLGVDLLDPDLDIGDYFD